MKIKDIPDCAVIMYKGEIGALIKTTGGKPQIHWSNNWATEVSNSDTADVVKYPAQLAKEFVSAQQAVVADASALSSGNGCQR